MKRPLFSCVVPVKGARPYMKDALDSLHMQGMGDDLEIIVRDADVEPDSGQSDALNKGFAKAKGEWLFWLNADDVLLRGALKKVQQLIIHNSQPTRLNWIAGNTVYTDENGSVRDVRRDAKWRPWFGRHLSVWTGGPSAFFRRSLWERLGCFDINLRYVMDIDLWTRWARAGERFVGINDYLWGFRMHPGSATMGGGNEVAHRAEKEIILNMCGLSNQWFWRNLSRTASVFDGSWFKRKHDSKLFYGKYWHQIVK